MSLVPLVRPRPVGCSPTEISISFSPFGENFRTIELPESTVQTLPCGSMRMLCGIWYSPFPQERTILPFDPDEHGIRLFAAMQHVNRAGIVHGDRRRIADFPAGSRACSGIWILSRRDFGAFSTTTFSQRPAFRDPGTLSVSAERYTPTKAKQTKIRDMGRAYRAQT